MAYENESHLPKPLKVGEIVMLPGYPDIRWRIEKVEQDLFNTARHIYCMAAWGCKLYDVDWTKDSQTPILLESCFSKIPMWDVENWAKKVGFDPSGLVFDNKSTGNGKGKGYSHSPSKPKPPSVHPPMVLPGFDDDIESLLKTLENYEW